MENVISKKHSSRPNQPRRQEKCREEGSLQNSSEENYHKEMLNLAK